MEIENKTDRELLEFIAVQVGNLVSDFSAIKASMAVIIDAVVEIRADLAEIRADLAEIINGFSRDKNGLS